jgi:hypothetical protein
MFCFNMCWHSYKCHFEVEPLWFSAIISMIFVHNWKDSNYILLSENGTFLFYKPKYCLSCFIYDKGSLDFFLKKSKVIWLTTIKKCLLKEKTLSYFYKIGMRSTFLKIESFNIIKIIIDVSSSMLLNEISSCSMDGISLHNVCNGLQSTASNL